MSPLKAERFFKLVAEVRDSSKKDLRSPDFFNDGERDWKRPESDP